MNRKGMMIVVETENEDSNYRRNCGHNNHFGNRFRWHRYCMVSLKDMKRDIAPMLDSVYELAQILDTMDMLLALILDKVDKLL